MRQICFRFLPSPYSLAISVFFLYTLNSFAETGHGGNGGSRYISETIRKINEYIKSVCDNNRPGNYGTNGYNGYNYDYSPDSIAESSGGGGANDLCSSSNENPGESVGQAIYDNNCATCHPGNEKVSPSSCQAVADGIMPPNGMSEEDKKALTGWLMAQ